MNLFLKIFLWFLAAIALMVGVIVFLNWTVQTEPVVSRWRISVRNQTNIFAETAGQIYATEGEPGLAKFLDRIRKPETIGEVDLIGENGRVWLSEGVNAENYKDLVAKALNSENVEIENHTETALSARQLTMPGGERYVLIVRWERPRMTPFFGESPLRYLRYAGLLLTALLLCWALARYLSWPIGKLRRATQKLAEGDLSTRVADDLGRRRDELASLARDFDVMAERLESLVTSQQRLSRDVSHELRSPLARMNVALEIAKQKTNGDAAPQLARIEAESQRLNDMISRLLTLSQLETGSKDFDRRELNLTAIVEQVAADADFEANAKGRSVKLTKLDDCRIFASESLVRSAVENVLRNAVRYTKEGTAVTVSLEKRNKNAILVIEDMGEGVPEAELANLFRPFYRVGEARDRGSGGTGLGLAIAEQAILAHDGVIGAKNKDGGLSVEISLPCVK
ncbi:MAG: HAMP domain-containing protein [Chloracidobacterium sp.]|nr:HAMP domain-containing protein [Chloracidobacterium sp.]